MDRRLLTAAAAGLLVVTASVGTLLVLHRPSTPRPTPSSRATLPTPSPGLAMPSCVLPMVNANSSAAGFLNVPSGTFTVDPTHGGMDRVYDAVLHRWLPTTRDMVSQDWKSYFYQAFDLHGFVYHLHYVDANGNDRYLRTDSNFLGLGGYGPHGLLFTPPGGSTRLLLDPTTGKVTIEPSDWYGRVSPDGGLWWLRSQPVVRGSQLAFQQYENTVYRRDMATGLVVTWYDHIEQGYGQIFGFDDLGHPMIRRWYGAAADGPMFMLLAPGKDWPVGHVKDRNSLWGAWADQHGVWFVTDGVLSLYTPSGQVRQISIKRTNGIDPIAPLGNCS